MHQTIRGEVLEKTVAIESGISEILGFIFDINIKDSKSLGYKSEALGFQHKIYLLTDLKFVPREITKQFILLLQIRNKFAHVQYVDNFVKCFELLPDSKNKLLVHVKSLDKNVDEEIQLQTAFTMLCFQLGVWMNLILERSRYLKMQDVKKATIVEMLRAFLHIKSYDRGSKEDEEFMTQIDALMKDIEQDNDFLTSVAEAVRIGEKKDADFEKDKQGRLIPVRPQA